jgi:CRP-like cAMP-binding protein
MGLIRGLLQPTSYKTGRANRRGARVRRGVPRPIPNRLLAALPPRDYRRLEKHLESVPLAFGQVLHEPGNEIRHVYFPNDSVVSLLSVVAPQKAAEVGMVGREGIVGVSAAIGIKVSQLRSVVQGAGTAMRMSASHVHRECTTNNSWHLEMLRFSHALMGQVAQTAACNRFHKAEARLARWLLVTRDRLGSSSFHLTHQFLSLMLGVRRVGVTLAAGSLEKRHLITYGRGDIRIVDSKGLEAAACECYQVVKSIYRSSYRTKNPS